MSNIVLFIFEGAKTEPLITQNLSQFFINEPNKTLLKASYGFNIYKLYEALEEEPGLDVHGVVVEELERRESRAKLDPKQRPLSELDRAVMAIDDPDEISDIYLFFDYDCHCSNANDEKLEKLLARFNDSQEDGLLCISYPMVEAIRHQKGEHYTYETHTTKALNGYKKWVNQGIKDGELDGKYQNWGLYTLPIWRDITSVNIQRAKQLTSDDVETISGGAHNSGSSLSISGDVIPSELIFDKQKEKHIPHQEVAVLSAFPLMLHYHYGDKLTELFTQP